MKQHATPKPKQTPVVKSVPPTGLSDKTRFWIMLTILILSLALAWYINSSFSQTLSNQFL